LYSKDKNLLDAETYYYKIGAVNAIGLQAAAEKPLQITTAGPPEPITDLRAQSGQIRMVSLTWTPSRSQTVSGYALYRSAAKQGPFHEIMELKNRKAYRYVDMGKGASSYSDFGNLTDHKTYFYKIRAINVVGVASPDSPVVSAVTRGAPNAVTGFMAQSGLARKAVLSWTMSQAKEIKGYVVYRSAGENGPFSKVVFLKGRKKAKYIDKGKHGRLNDNTEYFY